MRILIGLIILCGVVFFGYPLLNESTTSECNAFERAAVRYVAARDDKDDKIQQQVAGQMVQGLSQGDLAALWVKDEYPALPAFVGCTTLYWRAAVKPDTLKKPFKKLS